MYLTSDCLDTVADSRGLCADASNFNTGVMYLRSSVSARAFVRRWLDRMRHAGPEPWLDDQAILNNMLRPGLTRLPHQDGVGLSAASGGASENSSALQPRAGDEEAQHEDLDALSRTCCRADSNLINCVSRTVLAFLPYDPAVLDLLTVPPYSPYVAYVRGSNFLPGTEPRRGA